MDSAMVHVGVARLRVGLALAAGLVLSLGTALLLPAAAAASNATYTATETIPIPPASNYAGSGGGDGWDVSLSDNQVYNVFHHQSSMVVACHNQRDASACYDPVQVTDHNGGSFSTSGHAGTFLDQVAGKLYIYGVRNTDATPGVVCFDTTMAPANPFCGFTALGGAGDGLTGTAGTSVPMRVGDKLYAFNYFNSQSPTGAQDEMLCFDLSTDAACTGQPFAVNVGAGPVSDGTFPSPATAAIGNLLIVPINVNGKAELACFDASTQGSCSGSWPVASPASGNGSPFPLLDTNGHIVGFCLASGPDQCFGLDGSSVATPANMPSAIGASAAWNGPAFVLGPRVYVPEWPNIVDCYDYSTNASCTNFPKQFSNLDLLYTVNADPQRPSCIWVNSDNGSQQIQNFDAFTGGACGQGAIRVLASSLVVPTQLCFPSGYGSLQVVSPARSSYSDGTVSFEDFDANPLGIPDETIDNTGSVSLNGLNLNANGLPQFLITLNGTQGAPGQVVVKLTWTGIYDPSCVGRATSASIPTPPTPLSPAAPTVLTGPPTVQQGPGASFSGGVNPNDSPTTAYFQYGLDRRYTTPGASGPTYTKTVQAQPQPVGADATNHAVTASVSNLVPNALYHVRLVATNALGTSFGPDVTFVTPRGPLPGLPTLGQTFNISPVSGLVRVFINKHLVPLTEPEQIGPDVVIDTRHGTVELTTATGGGLATDAAAKGSKHSSKTQRGEFGGAVFRVHQATGGKDKGLTTVMLTESLFTGAPSQAICKAPPASSDAAAARISSRVIQLLHASAHGRFSSSGRYSAATVRGTKWTMAARCDGTLVRDIKDSVVVLDFIRHRTVILHPGQSYLAPGPRNR